MTAIVTTTQPWQPCWTRRPTSGHQLRIEQIETEIDNLRAAFAWSREHADIEDGLRLVSSLQPLWLSRGRRILEGLTWFFAVLTEHGEPPPM